MEEERPLALSSAQILASSAEMQPFKDAIARIEIAMAETLTAIRGNRTAHFCHDWRGSVFVSLFF